MHLFQAMRKVRVLINSTIELQMILSNAYFFHVKNKFYLIYVELYGNFCFVKILHGLIAK